MEWLLNIFPGGIISPDILGYSALLDDLRLFEILSTAQKRCVDLAVSYIRYLGFQDFNYTIERNRES